MKISKVLTYEEPPPPDHVVVNHEGKETEHKWETVQGIDPLHAGHGEMPQSLGGTEVIKEIN
jgi:hypothetical protein